MRLASSILSLRSAQRLLELIDGRLLLRPLLLEGRGELVVLALARERLLGELLVARRERPSSPCAPTPAPLPHSCVVLLREALLVGDRRGDLLLRLDELVVHVENDLVQHLLGIFRAADEVVQVALMSCARRLKIPMA